MSTDHGQTTRKAIICITALGALNAVFYFLSASYFDSHRQIVGGVSVPSYSPEQMTQVRMNFAVFSGVVAAFALAGWIWARRVGHLLPVLLGAFALVAGIGAFRHDAPTVLWVTLLVYGVLTPVLAWHSYRRSRAAWAFLIAMCAVFWVVDLFGAPKARGELGISLWITMILPWLNCVASFTLRSLHNEYVERDPVTA